MNATTTIDRRPAESRHTANGFQAPASAAIDFTELLADVVVLPQTRTVSRSIGSSGSWVTLDEQWGKRLGARRNGKRYRLSRAEFVRRMAEEVI